ncbi:glycosyltransferase family 2 protein [Acidithiobacillus sp. AMEEHan]|uniref:glycosyltransferase family 2 protein n=1 Tax=Acidithiobacillus sp. AMEEHan TaxID=2994951 RepID=UPI0027E440C5|nr:glycosyltransferase family 2 protein [Acidithiobacillus sp. AMEEHan]
MTMGLTVLFMDSPPLPHSSTTFWWYSIGEVLLLLLTIAQSWRTLNAWARSFLIQRRDRRLPLAVSPSSSSATPTVAVAMAVYNGEKFLVEQIQSILNQSHPHLHLYIRDDGSSDASRDLLRRLQERHPERITLIEDGESQLGVIGNFQRVLTFIKEWGKESYICLADQDDVWFTDKVATTLARLQITELWKGAASPVLVHSNLCVVDANLGVMDPSFWYCQHLDPGKDDLRELCLQNMVTGCTVMMNKALLEKALPIPSAALMQDWWLALVAFCFWHNSVHAPTHCDVSTVRENRYVGGKIQLWGMLFA